MNTYEKVKEIVKNGWLSKEKFDWFEKIINETMPLNIVEIGTFYGMSAISLGMVANNKMISPKVYAIDAWSADASLEGTNDKLNDDWWSALDYNVILRSFLLSIQESNLVGIVMPILGRSVDVANCIPYRIDLLHLDGNHSSEVISKELEIYANRVPIGGYIVADDAKWTSALDGYEKIPSYGFQLIYEHDKDGQSFNIYKKIK